MLGSTSGSASGEDSLQRNKRKGKRDGKRLNKITIFPMKGGGEQDAILRRGKVLKIDKDGRQRVREYVSKMPVLPEEMPTFTDESMSKITKTNIFASGKKTLARLDTKSRLTRTANSLT